MIWVVGIYATMHFLGCMLPAKNIEARGLNVESFRRHHERSLGLALIALAILWR